MNFWKFNKTIRPLKDHSKKKDKVLSEYAQETYVQASLGTGTMKSAVRLPSGEELHEWLAVNTVDFFNEISLLYGSIGEFCTQKSCPCMCAGNIKYAWMDGVKFTKPVECSAPEYVDYLLAWVEQQLNDESIFPLQAGGSVSQKLPRYHKNIFKRLFRVYAHIYHAHFKRIVALGAEAHLNTCFKHFLYFVIEFKLVRDKEMAPMKPLISKWIKKKKGSSSKSERKSRRSNSRISAEHKRGTLEGKRR